MENLLKIAEGFITSIDTAIGFLTTPIRVNLFNIEILNITPLGLITFEGLIMLATYYLIRGLTI